MALNATSRCRQLCMGTLAGFTILAAVFWAGKSATASNECHVSIVTAQTAADLETKVVACLKSKIQGSDIRQALQEKRKTLLAHPERISNFLSQLSPNAQKASGEGRGITRTSYLTSITARGIRPHILHIGIESQNNGEVIDVLLELGDQPI